MEINNLTHNIIGCAYKVHNVLGPGFLEKVYENALKLELKRLGIDVRQQVKLPVFYDGHQVGLYYPDLWIEGQLIIEIKAAVTLAPEHDMKLLHYSPPLASTMVCSLTSAHRSKSNVNIANSSPSQFDSL